VPVELALFAPCARGLEDILAEELRALGASRVRAARAGVSFGGGLETAYRACLWSRLASRVLLRIAEVPARDEDELYAGIRALEWEQHLGLGSTFAVDFTSSGSPITHTQYGALKTKDAIVDRFRELTGERPSVDTAAPDVRVNVAARARSAVVSIDLSGDALHRRGYREPGVQVEAPLKETLAAAVLVLVGWPDLASAGAPFLDPLCGSGTLAIEAAMIAYDRAPGILRAHWGFDGWSGHDPAVWHALLDEADERAEKTASGTGPAVLASDADPRAVDLARACVARAGLGALVAVEQHDALAVLPPEGHPAGLVAFNPPYGERLGDAESVERLFGGLGAHLREAFAGWRAAVISADTTPVELLGIPPEVSHLVRNGRIASHVTAGTLAPAPADSMFANRLRKNAKHLRKWARREGVTCYRVYDADMPEYAVAVDLYQGAGPNEGEQWAHIAEYAPPKTVDAAGAARRLAEVLAAVPAVLDVDPANVVLKERRRQRGTAQYEKRGPSRGRRIVGEGGLTFEVDLASYLDTGLFLDHRTTREMIRQRADGLRFCNLFAYTGTATVYAAAGGAHATTTVDLSATYLDWARANMRRNGFDGPEHEFVRAEVLAWLAEQPEAGYDLIFCDPPTFSNSKRMDATFDVQRDHATLLTAAARLLAPGGELWFSTNRQGFKLDAEALAPLHAEEFTPATIPPDFARTPRVHRIWRIASVAR